MQEPLYSTAVDINAVGKVPVVPIYEGAIDAVMARYQGRHFWIFGSWVDPDMLADILVSIFDPEIEIEPGD